MLILQDKPPFCDHLSTIAKSEKGSRHEGFCVAHTAPCQYNWPMVEYYVPWCWPDVSGISNDPIGLRASEVRIFRNESEEQIEHSERMSVRAKTWEIIYEEFVTRTRERILTWIATYCKTKGSSSRQIRIKLVYKSIIQLRRVNLESKPWSDDSSFFFEIKGLKGFIPIHKPKFIFRLRYVHHELAELRVKGKASCEG